MPAGDLRALAVGLLVMMALVVLASARARPEHVARTAIRREPAPAWRLSLPRGGTTPRRRKVLPRAHAPTSEDVAGSMVLLAVALQSGCGVVEAMEQVTEVAPRAPSAQLAVVAAAWRWGVPEDEAWAEVDPRWSRTAMALQLARE